MKLRIQGGLRSRGAQMRHERDRLYVGLRASRACGQIPSHIVGVKHYSRSGFAAL